MDVEKLTQGIEGAADRRELRLSRLWDLVKYLDKMMVHLISQNITTDHAGHRYFNGFVGIFSGSVMEKVFALCEAEKLSKAHKALSCHELTLVSLFPIFDASPVTKVFEICYPRGVRKHHDPFRKIPKANLRQPIHQDQFELFISEEAKASGEIINQLQPRQVNESSDPSESERQPTGTHSRGPIQKMRITSWCLLSTSKLKLHHCTAARQKLGMHLLSI